MMTWILQGVWFYRRTNLVVLFAVLIATAVIGGSLIVGDSVRASLQQMTLRRLGGISHVLHAPRFFREQLAAEMSDRVGGEFRTVAPAMLLDGSLERQSAAGVRTRAGSVIVLGVRPDAWALLESDGAAAPSDSGIVLGHRTATELQVRAGDEVSLWIERPSAIPRDSLLGEREDLNLDIVLTVEAVLGEDVGASRFSLNPGQQLPFNAFVALATLQDRLDLQESAASRRNPMAKPARVNSLLIGHPIPPGGGTPGERLSEVQNDAALQDELTGALQQSLTLADVGLNLRVVADRGYLSVESDSMILDDAAVTSVSSAAAALGLSSVPTLVYLANEIRPVGQPSSDSRFSMYSIVAGLPFDGPAPLGPFQLQDGSPVPPLTADDIILSDWLAGDLQARTGDVVEARWHEVGSDGELPETHHRFTVRGILKPDDPVSVDPNLTPFVDGVTNADSFSEWDQPFEMQLDRITLRDDQYWQKYKAAPKAFVALSAAEQFWSSRFGRATSIRVAPSATVASGDPLTVLPEQLSEEIRRHLQPDRMGLSVRPVRAEGLQAAAGANDFSQLFLAFSFFLILSAILLASLMFRLGIQQRAAQAGLLEALGFTALRARWFFLGEGLLVAGLGAVAGAAGAVAAARFMVYGLTHWWIGAIGTRFLVLDVQPVRLVTAGAISFCLAGLVIWQALRACMRLPPRELLAGGGSGSDIPSAGDSAVGRRWSDRVLPVASLLIAVVLPWLLLTRWVPSSEAFGGLSWRVVGFFSAGMAWLSTGLLLLRSRLRSRSGAVVYGGGISGLLRLALASTARNPQRSLLTTALIAFATFVIVAVGAGRRNPVSEVPDRSSGNGGFTLVAESSQPILRNLNSVDGRQKLEFDRSENSTLPPQTVVFGFGMKPGQDASCLNLYQTTVPTLLGATGEFIRRGGFRFASTPGKNPWELLETALPDSQGLPTIPVIGDLNTLQFSLKKGMGDVVLVPRESAPEYALQIVGMLDSSIFQGVLVMSAENLKRVAPETSGARYFLIETPGDAKSVAWTAGVLETTLNAYGVDTEPVSRRLAGFLAVQNTYLSTFQLLGGLGLLVGTFGLAAVMLRNVMERRGEIALLKALGFTNGRVMSLIFLENSVLLFWGMLTGTVAALVAMLPHLLSSGADVPWLPLGLTLGAIAVVGSLSAALPVTAAAGTPIRENLATA